MLITTHRERASFDLVDPSGKRCKRAISDTGHVVGDRHRGARPRCAGEVLLELLDWPIGHEEPGTAILAAPQGSIFVVFQQATDYQAPVWPPVDGEQRPMMHFDFQVGDLDSAVAEAVALGATVAAHQPQETVRVLLDPAGHPFCLCRDDG
jgi:hypothetical protein